MTPLRLAAERKILCNTFPACSLDTTGTLVLGTLTANSGRCYSVRLEVPATFPDAHPEAYITAPILYDRAGRKLAAAGASNVMHTYTSDGDWVQVCHGHPERWDSRNTLYTVLLKVRLWIEAYEAHLLDGRPIRHWLSEA
ncbi:hypothetical protein LBMAG42_57410 [Deltaproteobacteria bacterium]|nr:hypothetical protein LBMAG42_57410 [Deltaproteobacteria bacterium]